MRPRKHTLLLCCFLFLKNIEAVLNNLPGFGEGFVKIYNRYPDITMHKVSLTQKGYIQFLRYVKLVPPLTEYTFCVWFKSKNLTYEHPLLSYSKHEQERLIRVWVSPYGTDINLEILGLHLSKTPFQFVENHWYHVCQSWSNLGTWSMYLNGKIKSSGYDPRLQRIKIKGGGDIVVGQEYTDFDKGLDDGIEGDIFGFNFVLSSTRHDRVDPNWSRQYQVLPPFTPSLGNSGKFHILEHDSVNVFNPSKVTVRFQPPVQYNSRRVINDIIEDYTSPGQMLVDMGYKCYVGKGAPISGKDVLISWTKTPVRVFGGAVVKTITPFCL